MLIVVFSWFYIMDLGYCNFATQSYNAINLWLTIVKMACQLQSEIVLYERTLAC